MGLRTWLGLKSPFVAGTTIAPVAHPDADRPVLRVDEVLARRPAWVRRQIEDAEARVMADEIARSQPGSLGEIGVASGFSSAIIYAAAAQGSRPFGLYTFDLSEQCYYDPKKRTGAAFAEIHGRRADYRLKTGVTSANIKTMPPLDFLFIDASHKHPWPSLDLLSLSRFLRPGATVALHDVSLIFARAAWAKHENGPRDLFRSWRGAKWSHESAGNIGFLRYDPDVLADSLCVSLALDWDTAIDEDLAGRYVRICGAIRNGREVARVLRTGLNALKDRP